MAAGLGTLRLAPAAFWSMTPRELAAALRSLPGVRRVGEALTRTDLETLMQRFPDAMPLVPLGSDPAQQRWR